MPSARGLFLFGCWCRLLAEPAMPCRAFLLLPKGEEKTSVPPLGGAGGGGGGLLDARRGHSQSGRKLGTVRRRKSRRPASSYSSTDAREDTSAKAASSASAVSSPTPPSSVPSPSSTSSSSPPRSSSPWKRYDSQKAREMSWLVRSTSTLLGNSDAPDITSPPPGRLPRSALRTASAVMRAWAKRRSPHVVERIVLRINEERKAGNAHARATTTHYNCLLEAWCRSNEPGALRRATEIFDEMEECGGGGGEGGGGEEAAMPNARSCNILLKALLRSDEEGAMGRAESLLRRAERRGLVNVRSYNLLLSALARSGDAEKAEEVLRNMQALRERGAANVVPDINSYNQVIFAWSRNRTEESVHSAQAIFDEITARMNVTDVQPDTDTFNSLMGIWYRSGDPRALSCVEELFTMVEELYDNGNLDAKPDIATINTALSAFSKVRGSDDSWEKAQSIFDKSRRVYGLDPITLTFNILLKVLSNSRSFDTVGRAMEILSDMEHCLMSGDLEARPDTFTYTSIIDIISKSMEPNRGRKAENVLRRLERLERESGGISPNTQVYNALINAWASSRERGSTQRAEATLKLMEARHAAGNEAARPNTRSYNTVLKCLSFNARGRGGGGNARRAVSLLDRMEELHRSGGGSMGVAVVPDAYSYTTVIHAVARSGEPGKAKRAQEVLLRMVDAYNRGNAAARPNVFAFNACLNACAFTFAPKEKIDAFLVAVATVLLLQRFDQLDHTTYGTFLRVCSNLIPEHDDRRQSLVDVIFKRCCSDGQVSEMVLEQLRFAAAPDTFESLLGVGIADPLELLDLPYKWRRNVKERAWR